MYCPRRLRRESASITQAVPDRPAGITCDAMGKAPSPGRQSGGMCSTSPRLCQSVFLRGAVKGAGCAPVELDVSA